MKPLKRRFKHWKHFAFASGQLAAKAWRLFWSHQNELGPEWNDEKLRRLHQSVHPSHLLK